MIQNTQIKNPKMAVLSVDVVWTAEFAAKQYIEALPADQFPTDGFLEAATVDSATYFGKLYAYPSTSDGGLLYYRKDLLDKYGLKPPTSFDEMKAACDKIQAGEKDSKLGCFAGQYNKYEGLTVNFDEAVHGAGGVIVGEDGKPNVATPEATKGLQTLTDWFKDGHIPKAAITWQEEQGRQAFQDGELIFHRNWGYVYNLAERTTARPISWASSTWRRYPGITRSWCLQPWRSQLRDRQERGEQGHGGGLLEVHFVEGASRSQHSRDLQLPGAGGAVLGPGSDQEVPVHADPAQVDPGRQATSEGRGVR